jgi:hypothetical protein
MRIRKNLTIIGFSALVTFSLFVSPSVFGEEEQKPVTAEAKPIEVNASIEDDHPAIEEGVTCNDCHEIKLDANTTATQVWLTGDYLKWEAGEGIMSNEKIWERIVELFKEKGFKKTFVLATSFNNRPTTTTAEFALDIKKKVLYGLHEKGTEKVLHIQHNPYVCLNWHREFDDNFANILCIQVLGKAELLEGTMKEFEEGLSVYPYQYGATARKLSIEQWKAIIKKEMVMTRIPIDQIILVDGTLGGTEYRTSQRWTRD